MLSLKLFFCCLRPRCSFFHSFLLCFLRCCLLFFVCCLLFRGSLSFLCWSRDWPTAFFCCAAGLFSHVLFRGIIFFYWRRRLGWLLFCSGTSNRYRTAAILIRIWAFFFFFILLRILIRGRNLLLGPWSRFACSHPVFIFSLRPWKRLRSPSRCIYFRIWLRIGFTFFATSRRTTFSFTRRSAAFTRRSSASLSRCGRRRSTRISTTVRSASSSTAASSSSTPTRRETSSATIIPSSWISRWISLRPIVCYACWSMPSLVRYLWEYTILFNKLQ